MRNKLYEIKVECCLGNIKVTISSYRVDKEFNSTYITHLKRNNLIVKTKELNKRDENVIKELYPNNNDINKFGYIVYIRNYNLIDNYISEIKSKIYQRLESITSLHKKYLTSLSSQGIHLDIGYLKIITHSDNVSQNSNISIMD